MVADVILRLKTKPITQAHVGTKPPLIFGIKAGVDERNASDRLARVVTEYWLGMPLWYHLRLGRLTSAKAYVPLKLLLAELASGGAQPAAEFQEVLAMNDRGVILQLVVVGVIDDISHGIAAVREFAEPRIWLA